MRDDSKPTSTFAVAVASFAFALAPLAAWAEPPGGTTQGAPKHDAYKPGGGHGHGHGHDQGSGPDGRKQGHDGQKHGQGKPGEAAAAPKPVATLPPSPEVAKAVDSALASCPKALELRERIAAVADTRRASIAAIRTAQNEARKQLRGVIAAQKKLERDVKKAGADTNTTFENARVAHEAAVAQRASIETAIKTLRSSEDELAAIAGAADEAAAACTAAEATLRTAAAEARKAAGAARREALKARALARMPPAKALEATRAKQAGDLEALKKDSDEAKGAIEALKAVAAAAPPAGAPAEPKKTAAK